MAKWNHAAQPLIAHYGPLPGQSARCSPNFSGLNIPSEATEVMCIAQTGVPPEQDTQVIFAIEHDKTGSDTRWWSNIRNQVSFDPRECGPGQPKKGCGGTGEQELYVITTNPPPDKTKKDTFAVFLYWR